MLPMDPWPKSLAYQQCLADRIIEASGAVVQAGPFQGMACIRDAEEGCLVPKLLGCYEEELIPAVESLMAGGYDRVIDVGCASGYWLTGFAWRMPGAQAYGFDVDEAALARCRHMITLNAVQSRVALSGRCATEHFEDLIDGRTLLFMDCDGPEYELLDPELAPSLRRADIIVECHDYLDPRITPTLQDRFQESHSIEKIVSWKREPDGERYPGLKVLPRRHRVAALDERRPCVQNWLIMRSKLRG